MPENNHYHPFLSKRKSFEHEKELRAILQFEAEGYREIVTDNGQHHFGYLRDASNREQRIENDC